MQWMQRSARRLRRLFSRPGRKLGLAHYVRLTTKLANRLGAARSRARQAERDREFWRDAYQGQLRLLQGEIIALREANVGLDQRVREYEAAEKAAKERDIQLLNKDLKRSPYPPGVRL